jgi:AraC-like DNA-binding protein
MSSPFRSAAGTIARSTSAAMKPHGGATLGSTRPLRLARFGLKVTRVTWIRKNRHQAIDGGSSRKHDDRSAQRSRQARHRRQRRPSHPTATDDGSEAQQITDIAQKLSFSDPSHFARIFRKHTGTTPRFFRGRQGWMLSLIKGTQRWLHLPQRLQR